MPADSQLDLKALTAAADAVTDADSFGNIPEGEIDHPNVSSWSEHIARVAITAYLSCRALPEEVAGVVKELRRNASGTPSRGDPFPAQLLNRAASTIERQADEIARLKEALEIYESPFGRLEDGERLNVPDFYDELDFGRFAKKALGK